MARAHNPFGDGKASERIEAISAEFLASARSPGRQPDCTFHNRA